jgi:hypothetical protein
MSAANNTSADEESDTPASTHKRKTKLSRGREQVQGGPLARNGIQIGEIEFFQPETAPERSTQRESNDTPASAGDILAVARQSP